MSVMTNDTDEFRKTKKAIEKGQTPSRYVAIWSRLAVSFVVKDFMMKLLYVRGGPGSGAIAILLHRKSEATERCKFLRNKLRSMTEAGMEDQPHSDWSAFTCRNRAVKVNTSGLSHLSLG